jgi:hypothetical protein
LRRPKLSTRKFSAWKKKKAVLFARFQNWNYLANLPISWKKSSFQAFVVNES